MQARQNVKSHVTNNSVVCLRNILILPIKCHFLIYKTANKIVKINETKKNFYVNAWEAKAEMGGLC